jgi:hypothetical protein
MGILGDHEQRRALGEAGEQLQRRQPHHGHGRSRPLGHPQGSQERVPLAARQAVRVGQHRPQQLVQPGERKLRLARHPRTGQYPYPSIGCAPRGGLHQSGLSDPRIAEHQQRPAAVRDSCQQRLHDRDFRGPPDQLWHHQRPPQAEVIPAV